MIDSKAATLMIKIIKKLKGKMSDLQDFKENILDLNEQRLFNT